uniref:Heparan-sulfate 6-O-sulfotransferase n=1 Tax=Alona affinis TaxID=381656 RepID=A0A9N6ZF02_9CRUS|nr:EOG090X0E58 [Alona affinis]
MAAKRRPARLLNVQENNHIPAVHVEVEILFLGLIERDGFDLRSGTCCQELYFFITVLRNPVHRYLSEFRHVQRGATWKSSRHWCGGQDFTSLPHCYKGANWTGVELDEFMDCSYNLAHNRQTRMLADLNLVGCYNSTAMTSSSSQQTERDRVMLQSAKHNLARMAFFGLTEQQSISQYIFERTFRLDFASPFEQSNATLSAHAMAELTAKQLERVKQLNSLDAELYEYARQLLHDRFELLKRQDRQFERHWLRILRHRLKSTVANNGTDAPPPAAASDPAI